MSSEQKWDAFISHAVEDQEGFVRKLATTLANLGVKIWYAEFALEAGKSLSRSIDEGLRDSRWGIVIISERFIAKKWTEHELRGLVYRQNLEGYDVTLPIWHGVTREQVAAFSLPLADLIALNSEHDDAKEIAFKLLKKIRPDIYSQHERVYLEKLVSGEAIQNLQLEINQQREALQSALEELAQFKCAFCGAAIVHRGDVPNSLDDRDYVDVETYVCGHSSMAGELTCPCPVDPRFPKFEEYELRFSPNGSGWGCHAVPKAMMARMVHIGFGAGRTKEEAAECVKRNYQQRATPTKCCGAF